VVPGWEAFVTFVEQAAVVAESLARMELVCGGGKVVRRARLELNLPVNQQGRRARPRSLIPRFCSGCSASTASRPLITVLMCRRTLRSQVSHDRQATDS